MVLEVAKLDVKAGREEEFETSFRQAESILSSKNGYVGHELHRCIEIDNRYILLVRWETLEDHTKGFRGSPDYERWRQLLHDFYDPFPQIEHYTIVHGA